MRPYKSCELEEMKLKESIFSRRIFLNGFLRFGFLGLLGALLYPIKRYLLKGMDYVDPPTVPVPQEEILQNIVKKGYHIFLYGKKEAIVFRSPRTENLTAFFAICTHADCIIQYVPKEQHFWCACHNGYYDVDGKVIKGPPPKPLTPLDVIEDSETKEIVFSKRA